MKKSELAELIRKFKSGNATEAESALLEAYWQNTLQNAQNLDLPKFQQEHVKSAMLKSIKLRAGISSEKVVKLSPRSIIYRVAATLLLLAAVSSIWYLKFPVDMIGIETSAFHEIQTQYGERRTITLPDHSSVVLNGNSKLRYAKNWSDNEVREVWIDGEGFFAVQHTQSHQKFIVHTREGLNVEVLGTKFNVRTREHSSEVLLTEGKVKLDMANDSAFSVYLVPGELATMKKNQLSKRVVKDVQYTSWTKSKLVFDETPLKELAQILHDTYGMNVSFENEELKDRQLSGEISSATADDILFAIAETFDIQVTKSNDTSIVLSSK